jgi:hypothetical protein
MRLGHKRLVINGLKILFILRNPNETLDVQNFVPREAYSWAEITPVATRALFLAKSSLNCSAFARACSVLAFVDSEIAFTV